LFAIVSCATQFSHNHLNLCSLDNAYSKFNVQSSVYNFYHATYELVDLIVCRAPVYPGLRFIFA